jgi:alanyl-tRNA synthetase
MTERLYYNDPYLSEFSAVVQSVHETDGRRIVTLDRTAFYPASGGQPYDIGQLGSARVVDVVDADDGEVLHVIEGELTAGSTVNGRIDWTRRFDHMQQHTGQHVLSAAFDRVVNARTESFHLGSDLATIDLNRDLTPADITRAEEDANRIVWEDRAVKISFVDAAEAAKLRLRKEPAREGKLRLIDVEEYDLSACGGTHVSRTGAIGIVVVASWERFKGGTRVGFVCGGRALRTHRKLRDVSATSSRLLSILPDELPQAIERLQAEARDSRRASKDLQSRLARYEAQALATASTTGRVITVLDGWDQHGLKTIASAIAETPGHMAALVGSTTPSAIVVARHPEVTVDSAAILKQVIQKFGGKGGGRPELAQGGGLQGDPQAIVAYLRELL